MVKDKGNHCGHYCHRNHDQNITKISWDSKHTATKAFMKLWAVDIISCRYALSYLFFHSWNDISFWYKIFERRLHISKHSPNPGSQKRNDRAIVAQRIVTSAPAIWCQGCWYFYNLSSIKIYNFSSSKPSPNVQKLDKSVIFQISRGEEICQAQKYLCSQHVTLGFKRCTSTESFYN